jgi:hypothetical protein
MPIAGGLDMSLFRKKQKPQQTHNPWADPATAARNEYGKQVLQSYTSGDFPEWDGGGRCDVCLQDLTVKRAYAVPNKIFWNAPKYIDWNKERGVDESFLRMQAANDPSPGSAICEDCIHMFR